MASIASNISDVTENSRDVNGFANTAVKVAGYVSDKNEVKLSDIGTLTPQKSRIVAIDLDSYSVRSPSIPPSTREPLVPSVKLSVTEQSKSVCPEGTSDVPLTFDALQSALNNFRYDIHKEFQVIIKEQIRLFGIAKVNLMRILL